MTNYSRGANAERRVAEQKRAEGYVVIRSAGSKSSFDLVCLHVDRRPQAIQVKCGPNPFGGFGPAARAQFRADAEQAGATPLLAHVAPRQPIRYLGPLEWPS